MKSGKYSFAIIKSKYKIPNRLAKPIASMDEIARQTEHSKALYSPGIESFLRDMRGVFPIYKPPHTSLDMVKKDIDFALLSRFNDETNSNNIPSVSLISMDGDQSELDRRFDARAEDPKTRLARIGLATRLFPAIGYHSSGLTFCSVGDYKSPEEQFLTHYAQRGQYWRVKLILGISTGEPIHPDHLTDKASTFIIRNNLFTVDAQVLNRQQVETTPWVIEMTIKHALKQLANESRYKLYEKFMYEYGPSDTFITIAARHKEWLSEFNTTADTRVTGGKVISFDKGIDTANTYTSLSHTFQTYPSYECCCKSLFR